MYKSIKWILLSTNSLLFSDWQNSKVLFLKIRYLFVSFCILGAMDLYGQEYLEEAAIEFQEKYLVTKIRIVDIHDFSSPLFLYLVGIQEGDVYSIPEIEDKIRDIEFALRTQWYVAVIFERRYLPDKTLELYITARPCSVRYGPMGGSLDQKSLRIGFTRSQCSPAKAVFVHLGKDLGLSWSLPYLNSTNFGLHFFAELDLLTLTGDSILLRAGGEQFLSLTSGIRMGVREVYYKRISFIGEVRNSDISLGLFFELDKLYFLNTKKWGIRFLLYIDKFLFINKIRYSPQVLLRFLPLPFFEIDWLVSGLLYVGDTVDLDIDSHDLNILNLFNAITVILQFPRTVSFGLNTYFNLGFVFDTQMTFQADIMDKSAAWDYDIFIMGGFAFDWIRPDLFTTRLIFLTGNSVLTGKPSYEFRIESRF